MAMFLIVIIVRALREGHEDYLVAIGLEKKDKTFHVTTLWSQTRTECKKILKWIQLLNGETKDLESWTSISSPSKNINMFYQRFIFHNSWRKLRDKTFKGLCFQKFSLAVVRKELKWLLLTQEPLPDEPSEAGQRKHLLPELGTS